MVYDGYQVSPEEYFKETEEYMERFWRNKISSYDLKNRFPRVNTGYRDGKSVSEDYQPEAYDLPEGSRFTSHDVAMLGFISCGVIGIDSGEEYDRHKKFQEVMKELGGRADFENVAAYARRRRAANADRQLFYHGVAIYYKTRNRDDKCTQVCEGGSLCE